MCQQHIILLTPDKRSAVWGLTQAKRSLGLTQAKRSLGEASLGLAQAKRSMGDRK